MPYSFRKACDCELFGSLNSSLPLRFGPRYVSLEVVAHRPNACGWSTYVSMACMGARRRDRSLWGVLSGDEFAKSI